MNSKNTVEDCRVLDVNRWMREGIVARGVYRRGTWQWSNPDTGEVTASIGYEADATNSAEPWVRLHYTAGDQQVDYYIRLAATNANFGGIRWWFTCPLIISGRPCNRRVGKLYLPPGGTYFGCRHCYDLTYTSCQESHRFDGLYRMVAAQLGITTNAVKDALK